MNPKYTPAPWKLLPGHKNIIVCTDEGNIIAIVAGDTAVAKANVHLIVMAPELVAALDRLIKALPKHTNEDGDFFKATVHAVAVLTKATDGAE